MGRTILLILTLAMTVRSQQGALGWLPPSYPLPSSQTGMVYDEARQRLVLYGGNMTPSGYHYTWEWDGTAWVWRRPAVSPEAFEGAGLVYDSVRQRTVLFGGRSGFPALENETWEWDGFAWAQRTPAVSPQARENHAVAYDSARQRVVLFGGDASGYSSSEVDDTWEWDGTSWTQLAPAQGPERRADHAMAFDRARGRVVLFGGHRVSLPRVSFDDTWEWDGATWTRLEPPSKPTARRGHSMAYDSVRQRVVMFGGQRNELATTVFFQETWEWDGTTWTQVAAGQGPSVQTRHPMAYDAGRQRMVLFDSARRAPHADTWEWDGSTWTLRTSSPAEPPWRYGNALAHDVVRQRTILFGGIGPAPNFVLMGDTWALDQTTWTRLNPAVSPSPRALSPMVWDPARQRLVLFGGFACGGPPACSSVKIADDTWEWDGAAWSARSPTARPPARLGHGMVWDVARQRAVLFGGRTLSRYQPFADTWEWDGTTWLQRDPTVSPAPREGPGMAYDPLRQRVVLFGGGSTNPPWFDDTWEWDGTTWRPMSPAASPGPRRYPAMSWDAARGHVVMFGGQQGSATLEDSWEWDGVQWARTATAGPRPVGRWQAGIAFDTALQSTVLFGGLDSQGLSVHGTWSYSGTLARSARFGVACSGSRGAPVLGSFGPAALGRASFGLDLLAARAAAPTALLLASAPANIPLGNDCALLINPVGSVVVPGITSTAGVASFPLPLPAATALTGQTVWAQSVVVDPAAPVLGLALSAGLAVTLGN